MQSNEVEFTSILHDKIYNGFILNNSNDLNFELDALLEDMYYDSLFNSLINDFNRGLYGQITNKLNR